MATEDSGRISPAPMYGTTAEDIPEPGGEGAAALSDAAPRGGARQSSCGLGLKLPAAATVLLGLAALAAWNTGDFAARRPEGNKFEYDGLGGAALYCDANADNYFDNLPRWDPDYSSETEFFNSCYHAFRCCTTSSNGNGCYVSDNFGALCRSCLGQNPPLMVRKPCADFVEQCGREGASEACGIPLDQEYTVEDLMSDNGVPTSLTPEWAVKFAAMPGCWNQFGARDKRTKGFADKCWEVVTWCQGSAKVCPRDGKAQGHVYCKHCAYMGFMNAHPEEDARDEYGHDDPAHDPPPPPAPAPEEEEEEEEERERVEGEPCTIDLDCNGHADEAEGEFPECECYCSEGWMGDECADEDTSFAQSRV